MMEHTEKIAYLKALIYIATADDTIDESEREKFSQLGHIYGLNEDEINSIADSVINKAETLEEILGNISTRQTKLLLVYDLLALILRPAVPSSGRRCFLSASLKRT